MNKEGLLGFIESQIENQPTPYGVEETASAGTMWNGGYSNFGLMLQDKIQNGDFD